MDRRTNGPKSRGALLRRIAWQILGTWTDISIGIRNVVRQQHRTALALVAVTSGVVAYLLAAGFIEWTLWGMREDTIRSHLGHLQVAKKGYFDAGTADPWRFVIDANTDLAPLLERSAGVVAVAPRLAFSGLASVGDATLSFLGEGLDPGREGDLSRSVLIVQGSALDTSDPNGVILGQGLALNLGAKVGDTIVLLSNTRTGGINGVQAKVRGIFSTVSKQYDDHALRAPLPLVQKLLRASGVHKWVILLDSTEATQDVLARLRPQLDARGIEIIPWVQLADFYSKTVTLFRRQVGVVELIIAVIIVLSISNSLMMAVLERTSEIGTALALGVNRGQILRRFVAEGLAVGVAGGLLGVLIGALLARAISLVGIPMPPPPGMARGYVAQIAVSWPLAAESIILAVTTTFIASLYPAWRAARLSIVDALRQGR